MEERCSSLCKIMRKCGPEFEWRGDYGHRVEESGSKMWRNRRQGRYWRDGFRWMDSSDIWSPGERGWSLILCRMNGEGEIKYNAQIS